VTKGHQQKEIQMGFNLEEMNAWMEYVNQYNDDDTGQSYHYDYMMGHLETDTDDKDNQ
jgi:hypothetical protein